MGVTASDLTKLYLAYFGRPPDFDGVQFYTAPPEPRLPGVGSDSIPLSALSSAIRQLPRGHHLHRPIEHWRHQRKRGASG